MIEIKQVTTKKDKKLFVEYPIKLYKDCPYYVPSLVGDELNNFDPKKNFSLKNSDYVAYLAYKDGVLVGRIAGIISYQDNEISGKKSIRFSRFECIDDIEVFKALLSQIAKYGKEKGMEIIHGPWGFNDQDREGMLTEGFDVRSTYATNYYYPYFHENLEKLGFEDESKWVEMCFEIPNEVDPRSKRLSGKLLEKYKLTEIADKLTINQIVKQYGEKFFKTLDESYGHLDGYVPYDEDTQKNILDQFGTIINTRYISILVDENDDVAAFGICLPSICNALIKSRGRLFPFGFIDLLKSIKKPKELEMALIGLKKQYKNSGVNAIIINRIMQNLIEDKIERIESNPMLQTNHSIQQQWKFAKYEIVKQRQTYKMNIDDLLKA